MRAIGIGGDPNEDTPAAVRQFLSPRRDRTCDGFPVGLRRARATESSRQPRAVLEVAREQGHRVQGLPSQTSRRVPRHAVGRGLVYHRPL